MEKNHSLFTNTIFLYFFIIFFTKNSDSNCSCPTHDVVFNTQQQIDEFGIQSSKCSKILGNVIISGNDIENLNGLSQLTLIRGFLHIVNNNRLKNLDGLSKVSDIFEDILIVQNNQLEDIDGLAQLILPESLAKGKNLKNKNSVIQFHSIGRDYFISKNGSLKSLEDFSKLKSNPDYLRIAQRSHLEDLNSFFQITSFGKKLSIINNQKTNRYLIIVSYK